MGTPVQAVSPVTTFLFTDIEDSTRLWDEQPERMRPALAAHDLIARKAVSDHGGTLVKMTGDGMYAAFDDPLDAIAAAVQLQLGLAGIEPTHGVALSARCGLHAGIGERRDNDFFGTEVNRAARIMSAAHGGQVLLSQAAAVLTRDRLPGGLTLRELGAARLRGLTAPEHLYQLQHPRLREHFPALRSLEGTPNNLPQQLSSFIGRERTVAEVTRLLGNTRLLTLVGIGWNFAFIGATTLVTLCHRPEERNKVQSFNDFLIFGTMALGSFASGKMMATVGWEWVNIAAFVPVLVVALLLVWLKLNRRGLPV